MKIFMIILDILILLIGSCCFGGDWKYDESVDKMRNQTTKKAYIESLNRLNFSFPYHGGTTAILAVRKKSNNKDILLTIVKGQFYCPSYSGCSIAVKFDDGKIDTFRAVPAENNDTTILFIEPYTRFFNKLKKSKKLTIEAAFFHEGRRQIEFDVAGLSWD